MLKHLQTILADFDCIPNRLFKIVSQYILFLMLSHKKHELRTVAKVFGLHESNYSRMLAGKQTRVVARSCLKRAIKRRLAKIKSTDEVFLIIDATLSGRSGKGVQNTKKFRHNGRQYVEGHQVTNFVLVIGDELIPLASVPLCSKEYCKELGFAYQTEIDIVAGWFEMLPESWMLPAATMKNLHFLLDSGYDAKSIQNAIAEISANFTAGITSECNLNGLKVKEYFQRHREIYWRNIRLVLGNGRR